jgi:coenzyme F420-reducing hydrogenase delta subunit
MNSQPVHIVVFYCANALDAAAFKSRLSSPDDLKTVSLPCSGKVNLLYLLKAFEKGADGVLLVTCPHGDCKFLEGNLRALKRAQAVDALLVESGLAPGRMRVIQKTNESGVKQIFEEIENFKNEIRISSGRTTCHKTIPLQP